MIQLALYSSIANPPHGKHLEQCVDETVAEAQLAESCGFEAMFLGEHHQDQDGFPPSPLIVCTTIAAHTSRLKVGTSVILLPLYHPMHVAEDVATLDIVSHGRTILGWDWAQAQHANLSSNRRSTNKSKNSDLKRLAKVTEPRVERDTRSDTRSVLNMVN